MKCCDIEFKNRDALNNHVRWHPPSKTKLAKAANGESNGMWKGDNVQIEALHAWVQRHKQKPPLCECCKAAAPRDLANISQKYKRDVNDYEWLCRRCHMTKDGRLGDMVKRNKLNKMTGSKHPNWQGGIAKSECIDCGKIISRQAIRCINCHIRRGAGRSND